MLYQALPPIKMRNSGAINIIKEDKLEDEEGSLKGLEQTEKGDIKENISKDGGLKDEEIMNNHSIDIIYSKMKKYKRRCMIYPDNKFKMFWELFNTM